jgi:hypothetical protein
LLKPICEIHAHVFSPFGLAVRGAVGRVTALGVP